jgi:hypothetical protein
MKKKYAMTYRIWKQMSRRNKLLIQYQCCRPHADEWQHFEVRRRFKLFLRLVHVGPCREFDHEHGPPGDIEWPDCMRNDTQDDDEE